MSNTTKQPKAQKLEANCRSLVLKRYVKGVMLKYTTQSWCQVIDIPTLVIQFYNNSYFLFLL